MGWSGPIDPAVGSSGSDAAVPVASVDPDVPAAVTPDSSIGSIVGPGTAAGPTDSEICAAGSPRETRVAPVAPSAAPFAPETDLEDSMSG